MSCPVAAIVPAAGLSRRMGSCKQLLDLGGKPVLAHCLETLLAGGITEIVVVVNQQGGAVAALAERYPVRVVVNPDPAGEMASSVMAGRAVLASPISGVMIALADCPLIAATTIAVLRCAHGANPDAILIPCHNQRKGHPTLFPSAVLAELTTGGTLRDVVRHDPGRVRLLEVADPGILMDMDTPADYQQMCMVVSQSRESAAC